MIFCLCYDTHMTSTPVTLADLDRDGKLLWLYCNDCGHEVEIAPLSIGLPPEHSVPAVRQRMKCSVCGSRKITSRPELYPGGIGKAPKGRG